jgi:Uma2 family endonuclease
MVYLSGSLYLTTPTLLHETKLCMIGQFIVQWGLEKLPDLLAAGATTFQREDPQCGLEPDACFYIGRTGTISPEDTANSRTVPVPDLAVEVHVSNFSNHKFPVYATLGVPEVWIWRKGLRVLVLEEDKYVDVPESRVLPGFPIAKASELLDRTEGRDSVSIVREFVDFIRK